MELIGSVARPQLPIFTPSPGPDIAVLIQRECVRPSAGGRKHRRDALNPLKLRNIPRRAPQLAFGVVSSREDASLRVDEDHSFVEGSQASERSFRTAFHLDKGRLESAVGVAEAQLPFEVFAQHPEVFGLCHEELFATSHLDDWGVLLIVGARSVLLVHTSA